MSIPLKESSVKDVHPDLFPLERQELSGRSLGGQKTQFAYRKFALLQHLSHLLAHGAGGADNGNIVFFFFQ